MKSLIIKLINKKRKFENYLLLLPIIFIFKSADEFAIPWDEPVQRLTGAVNLKYLVQRIGYINLPDSTQLIPELNLYQDKVFGPIFEIFSICLEWIFSITPRNQLLQGNSDTYFFRHFLTALTCYLLSIYLYKLVALRFSDGIAFVTFLTFWTTPRFIAEAFFNSKDMLLLCLMFPFLFYIYRYISSQKLNYLLSASFFLGVAISIRLSILLIFIISIILLYLLDKKQSKNILIYLFGTICVTIIVWPFLWQDPVNNFTFAIKDMLNRSWNGNVLFDGKMISANNLPWNYLLKWNLITIPIVVLSGFCFAIIFLINDFRKVNHETKYNLPFDYFIFSTLLLYHFSFIVIKPTLYDGWRHFYFTYSLIIYSFAYAIFNLLKSLKHSLKIATIILVSSSIITNMSYIENSFPLSNLYFNELVAKNRTYLTWEIDYWGTSNYRILKDLTYFIEVNGINKVSITTNKANPLYINLRLLTQRQSENVQIYKQFDQNTCLYLTNFRMETSLPSKELIFIDHFTVRNLIVASLYANPNCIQSWKDFSFKNIVN